MRIVKECQNIPMPLLRGVSEMERHAWTVFYIVTGRVRSPEPTLLRDRLAEFLLIDRILKAVIFYYGVETLVLV